MVGGAAEIGDSGGSVGMTGKGGDCPPVAIGTNVKLQAVNTHIRRSITAVTLPNADPFFHLKNIFKALLTPTKLTHLQ
jgi:hypothetical protein